MAVELVLRVPPNGPGRSGARAVVGLVAGSAHWRRDDAGWSAHVEFRTGVGERPGWYEQADVRPAC